MKYCAIALVFAASACAQQTPAQEPADYQKLHTAYERGQRILHDWPNLHRYHDANALLTPPTSGEKRVVFMGDSITDIWGHRYGKFFPGKPYVNRGISGQTTPQMLIRFRPDVIALKPKVVVVLAGTNDIAGNTGPTTLEAESGPHCQDHFSSAISLGSAGLILRSGAAEAAPAFPALESALGSHSCGALPSAQVPLL